VERQEVLRQLHLEKHALQQAFESQQQVNYILTMDQIKMLTDRRTHTHTHTQTQPFYGSVDFV